MWNIVGYVCTCTNARACAHVYAKYVRTLHFYYGYIMHQPTMYNFPRCVCTFRIDMTWNQLQHSCSFYIIRKDDSQLNSINVPVYIKLIWNYFGPPTSCTETFSLITPSLRSTFHSFLLSNIHVHALSGSPSFSSSSPFDHWKTLQYRCNTITVNSYGIVASTYLMEF